MGLDGISVNQLRITPENNSNELNKSVRFSLEGDSRPIDGLSSGQKVDPDKEKEREKRELYGNDDSNENAQEETEMETVHEEPVIKYDLSKTEKYSLKIEDTTNEILIIEKASKNVVQRLDAASLSAFVNFLANPRGSIINRKF